MTNDATTKKPHVSVSSLSKYRLCPRQWYYSYVERRPRQKNDNLIIGSALHSGCEYNYRQKITSGNDCAEDEVIQVAIEKVRAEAENGYSSAKSYTINDMEGVVEGLCRVHHEKVAPHVMPAFVEYEFTVDLGEDFPVTLYGFIDCITVEDLIIDIKSWGRAKGQRYADNDMQLTAYAFAFRSIFRRIESGLRFDVVTKTGYKYAPLSTTRTNQDIRWFLLQLEQLVDGMQRGVVFPNDDHFLCSEMYCDHWSVCRGEGV